MTNVVGLHGNTPKAAEPQPDVIAMLERLLEGAKAGDVQLCAVAWVQSDGTCMDAYTPGGVTFHEIMPLISSLELLKHTLLMNQYEASTGPMPG